MNEIVNKFLLKGDKVMPEMRLRQPEFNYSACRQFTTNKEYKSLKKQKILDIFIKMNKIKLVFNMAWLMLIQK